MNNIRYYESEAITSAYAKHRNLYPKQLADVIMEYAFQTKPGDKKKLGRLVEVGCGSGQITKLLAPHFDEVIASDVSVNQIKYAKESNTFEHVKYVVGAAEDIQVTDQSADMVVSATSVHWFNVPKFFNEVARVLKPDGCLAIIWYELPECSPPGGDVTLRSKGCTEVMNDVMNKASHGKYESGKNSFAEVFENSLSERKTRKFISRTITYNLTGFKGYLRSEDSFHNTNQGNSSESKSVVRDRTAAELDLAEEFGRQLKRVWKMEERSDEEIEINATFKFAIVLARNLRV